MPTNKEYQYKQLGSADISLFEDLMKLFAEVFEDTDSYQQAKPSQRYIENFLRELSHIVLVAMRENVVVGGLVAYELKKFEQERSEIYIYDLAVSKHHQRKKLATSLVENLKSIAKKRGVYIIFVQADMEDKGATSFYKTMSTSSMETQNFDIKLDL